MIPTDLSAVERTLQRYGVAMPKRLLPALLDRLASDAKLVAQLLEPIDAEVLPALRPEWMVTAHVSRPTTTAPTPKWPDGYGTGRGETTGHPSSPAEPLYHSASCSSPLEAVERALSAWEANPDAAVFTELFRDDALEDARRLEAEFAGAQSKPPLWGTTVAVKDLINMAGRRMTGGSKALNVPVAGADAAVVSALRRAGAVVIGANNLHELAFGTTGENPHFGTVQNPAAPGHLAGGSSSGSAAAVGFGMATFAIGTDTGGSIRIPAACCGIVGFKPSFNLVSREGTFPLGYSLDHLGPLTNTVADAARVMDVLVGQSGFFTEQLEIDLRGVRLGIPDDYFPEADSAVKAAYGEVLRTAESAGATMVPVRLPNFDITPAVYLGTSGAEAIAIHYNTLVEAGHLLGDDVRVRLAAALFIPAFARIRAQQWRRVLFEDLVKAFAGADVLVTPTLPVTPPVPGTTHVTFGDTTMPTPAAFLRNTSPFNLTGVPAVSIPCGADARGVPIGIQITGPYDADRRVLQIARAIERGLARDG